MLTSNQRAALAARLRQGRAAPSQTIPSRPADQRDLPLSFAQEQLWFLDKLAPGRSTYTSRYCSAEQGAARTPAHPNCPC